MTWVLYFEYFLELALFIFYFCLIVNLYRADVVKLDWESEGLGDRSELGELVLELLHCEETLVGTESCAFQGKH